MPSFLIHGALQRGIQATLCFNLWVWHRCDGQATHRTDNQSMYCSGAFFEKSNITWMGRDEVCTADESLRRGNTGPCLLRAMCTREEACIRVRCRPRRVCRWIVPLINGQWKKEICCTILGTILSWFGLRMMHISLKVGAPLHFSLSP